MGARLTTPAPQPVAPPAPVLVPIPTAPDDATVLAGAANLAKPFEGFSAKPYRDPAGVWTIGYGSTRDANGNPVTSATPAVTEAQALVLMERDMRSALTTVKGDVKVPLTAGEEEALTDFVYNVGAGNFAASTMLRKLNAGDLAGAAAEFPKWNLAGGKVLAGLVKRRAAEQALFRN